MAPVPGLVQDFIDSDIGLVVATAFHTLGAIGLLGGLVGYVAWHRHLGMGQNHAKLLGGSAALTYMSIVVNLAGGFMRTWGEGHPPLSEFSTSPWVRAITLKHIFLFIGMGAAVYLFEVVARRDLARFRAGGPRPTRTEGHAVGVLLVTLGIVMAGILGAASRVTPLSSLEDTMGEEHDGHDNETVVLTAYDNTSGQLTSTPVDPNAQTGTFVVPPGSSIIDATLTWSPTQFDLALTFTDPDGAATQVTQSGGRLSRDVEDPAPGTWGYSIGSDLAIDVEWDLSIRISYTGAGETLLVDTVTVAPGQFCEINTDMPLNATLNWDWSTSEVVAFNVHSHFDDEVQDLVDLEADEHAGSYSNEREGGHSLLWQSQGNLPVTLEYRVWGAFELHPTSPYVGCN